MKLHQLLFSRSLSQDYRWMLAPDWITSSDLKKLREIYYAYDEYKTEKPFDDTSLTPVYFINLRSVSALVICSPTNQTDQYSRQIYGLQGIAVPDDYKRHLWFALPWILSDYKKILNVWSTLDARSADQLQKSPSPTINFDLNESNPSRLSVTPTEFHDKSKIEYSQSGFQKLLSIVTSNTTPRIDFAFGVTSELEEAHEWDLIAKASRKSYSEVSNYYSPSNREERTDNRNDKSRESDEYTIGSSKNKKTSEFEGKKYSGLNTDKKITDEINAYEIICIEVIAPSFFSTGGGVYLHGKKNALDKILDKYFSAIKQNIPSAINDRGFSDVYSVYSRNQSFESVRIYRLGGRDKEIGQWLVKQFRTDEWKEFEGEGNRKNQLWLKRFKSLG